MTFIAADVNELALSIFGVVVAVTLFVTYLASKRVANATDFWAAGRGLTGVQNGFAIAGDYMSAASFLGIAGLIFLFGFDGFLYSVGFLVAFLTVLFLLGERMRNAGKYTIADVLSFRMNQKPARAAAALGTLAVAGFYLIAQMVGAGVFTEARANSPEGQKYLEPGLFLSSPIDTVSLGLALVLGTAGLPHILMRFFTVPDAKGARSSEAEPRRLSELVATSPRRCLPRRSAEVLARSAATSS